MIRTALAPCLVAAMLAAPGAVRADGPIALLLATGSPSGVYHPLGATLALTWTREIDGLTVEAEPTGGSVVNVRFIDQGDAQIAFVQTDIVHYATAAEEMFAGEAPLAANLGIAMLYPEPVQIVTLAGSGVASVDDLAGRRVSVGARGSGTELNARQILDAHGLDYATVHVSLMPFEDAVEALRNGYIDAAFLTAGVPTGAVANLTRLYGHDIDLVAIDPDRVAGLVERWPFYSAMTIPAGTYRGVEHDTPTVAVRAMLVASSALGADVIAALLENLYSGPTLSRLCGAHRRGCDVELANGQNGMPIAMHPGAEAFYAERLKLPAPVN